jgi:hypothetical protein
MPRRLRAEVRQGRSSRWMRVNSQGPASATTGMVAAGEDERSENPNQGHPAPPGDRTGHIGEVAGVCASRAALSTGLAGTRRTLQSCKTVLRPKCWTGGTLSTRERRSASVGCPGCVRVRLPIS